MQAKQNRKFYKKLLSTFLVISIIPALFIGVISSILMEKILQERLVSESAKTTDSAMMAIDLLMKKYSDTLEEFCTDELIGEVLLAGDKDKSLSQKVYEKMYATLSLLHPSGDIHIIGADSDFHLSLRDFPDIYDLKRNQNWGSFRLANSSSGAIVYPTLFTSSGQTEMIASAIMTIREGEDGIGYVAFDVPLEAVRSQVIGTNDLLPINFTLMTDNYYLLFNDIGLPAQTQFVNWTHRSRTQEKGFLIEKDGRRNMLYTFQPSTDYKFILIGGLNIDLIAGNLSIVSYLLAATALIAIGICITVSFIVSRHINLPLQKIVYAMQLMESGDFDQRAEIIDNDEFGYLASQFNGMCRKIKELFQKDHEKQELLRIAEMKNLHSQINPHFLYNTLDSIKWLAKMNHEQEIYTMVKNLGFMLKNSMHLSREFVTIRESLNTLEAYIGIQQIRFADKFVVDTEIEEAIMDHKIPTLILQPLVENAMIHGLEPKPGIGTLMIRGFVKQGRLIFQIQDDGIGMEETELAALIASLNDRDGTEHIGLKNVNQRIKLYYGDAYGVSVESMPGRGSSFTLTLPFLEEWKND